MSRSERRRHARAGRAAPPAARTAPWSWSRDGLPCVALAVIAFVVFANTLGAGFTYDDATIIRDNPRLEQLGPGVFFRTTYWGSADAEATLYRPLTLLSFAVDRAIFGPGPFGVHLANVLLNALIAVVVYGLVRSLVRHRGVATIAALLFALHPVHTEVVANGVGRSELGAALFAFLAVWSHVNAVRSAPANARRAIAWTAAAAGAFGTALFFKESAVVTPGLMLSVEWLIVDEGRWRRTIRRWPRWIVYLIPFGLFMATRQAVVGSGLPAPQEVMAYASGLERMLYASETLMRQAGQLLLPWHLCAEYADYRHLAARTVTDPLAVGSVVFWMAVAALLVWLYRRGHHVLVLGGVWMAVAILPVSNLLFPIGTVRADRLLFLPSFGFVFALAWLLGAGLARRGGARVASMIAMTAFTIFYAVRTVDRNRDWQSQETLWAATVRQNPGSPLAWTYVGDAHRARGELAPAEAAYHRAIELRDAAGFVAVDAHARYAELLARRGQRDRAAEHYRLVLTHRPDDIGVIMNLGEILLHEPATRPEAIERLEHVCRLRPRDFRPFANLAQARRLAGHWQPALEAIERAIALEPREAGLLEIESLIRDEARRAGVDLPGGGS
ncbi:MAG: tetratricopeptide repeat protein [Phycisphaerae bacterium]|nr:tetratricopeptide repeat protein [Phycisphaerae bacterium]NNF44051.1 tetratricopeptide repeat protein [Phycisphaerales bacterium]